MLHMILNNLLRLLLIKVYSKVLLKYRELLNQYLKIVCTKNYQLISTKEKHCKKSKNKWSSRILKFNLIFKRF